MESIGIKQTFYSNGKLLITGEYVVLDGAKAFALPTRFGQNLIVEETETDGIHWTSYDSDNSIWFEDNFSFSEIIQKTSYENNNIKTTLIEILYQAYCMNPDFISNDKGYRITTQLTFPKAWGLGTSSTLINNVGQWLRIDAFELLQKSFGGSGYDIACAQNNTPIIYQLINGRPLVMPVKFNPDFTDKIFFIYLNKKQNSNAAIRSYFGKKNGVERAISVIDALTQTIVQTNDPKTFALGLQQHEIELSNVLEMVTVKEMLFPDFNGVIKSLGAWGGDFVLSISKENPTKYFKEKGFPVVIPYQEMILTS